MSTINYDSKKSIRGAFGEELAELGKNIPNVVALDAVSYTHLDVYKRQLQGIPDKLDQIE